VNPTAIESLAVGLFVHVTRKSGILIDMQLRVYSTLALALLSAAAALHASEADNRRLADATSMFKEIMDTPDRSIPRDLLKSAECTVLVPGLKKAGLIVGAKYGRGFAACRTPKGWSAPVAMRVEGGSFGFQIGASETDIILLVMNKRGMERLLSSKFTLGAEASVAAGPVGRESQAQTDVTMRAEILSWSRSRGVFAGIALQGATLRADSDTDEALYGKVVNREDVLNGKVDTPPAAAALISTLNRFSGVGN
jgi:lipid-binding SYLF domain-containing protein